MANSTAVAFPTSRPRGTSGTAKWSSAYAAANQRSVPSTSAPRFAQARISRPCASGAVLSASGTHSDSVRTRDTCQSRLPRPSTSAKTKDALIRGLLAIDHTEARTTVIASHDLAEMELLVDHLLVLDGGRVRLAGDLDALRSHAPSAATLRDLYVRHTSNSPTRMEPAA